MTDARHVHSALEDVRSALDNLSDGDNSEAMDVVLERVHHAMAEVEAAWPMETHDWVRVGQFRFCAHCEREETFDGRVTREGVRPCSFDRGPENFV